jgi:hypothetical protein
MGISVRLLLNLSSILTREQDDIFFSPWNLYVMITTLPPESKTFLQECTISLESTQHFYNFWTNCNDCSTRYLRMHTTSYDMVIKIGGSEVVICRLNSYVVRNSQRFRGSFEEVLNRTRTKSCKCWTEVLETRYMSGACWSEIVLLSS